MPQAVEAVCLRQCALGRVPQAVCLGGLRAHRRVEDECVERILGGFLPPGCQGGQLERLGARCVGLDLLQDHLIEGEGACACQAQRMDAQTSQYGVRAGHF